MIKNYNSSYISFSTFKNNSNQGCIKIFASDDVFIMDSLFENNSAENGGSIYLEQISNNISISKLICKNGKAISFGGCIIIKDSFDVFIMDSLFENNSA